MLNVNILNISMTRAPKVDFLGGHPPPHLAPRRSKAWVEKRFQMSGGSAELWNRRLNLNFEADGGIIVFIALLSSAPVGSLPAKPDLRNSSRTFC